MLKVKDVRDGPVRQVAVVAREPLLREGVRLLVDGPGARVVACASTVAELELPDGALDVLIAHVEDASRVRATVDAARPLGARLLLVHDGISRARLPVDSVTCTFVDTRSPEAVLVAAVTDDHRRTVVPWARPRIGPMPLSRLERSVLQLVAEGQTSRDVGTRLGMSVHTVEQHKRSIFERLGVQNQAQAVSVALRAGLFTDSAAGEPVPARSLP